MAMELGTQAILGEGGTGDRRDVYHWIASTKCTGVGIDGGDLVSSVSRMMFLGPLDLLLV